VITAAAAGNVIEWYDFYIFGSLATILAVKFFEKRATCKIAAASWIFSLVMGLSKRPQPSFG
jgi:hypothetical protein